MSFLNPVNEPVLRFKSTDASAPQINYNARTAGDVKAVLKACLVTGYGAKASAGWSIANEVDYVAEFVSPSVAMSDYRLGVDDTSASSTTWYYQYQDARVNPSYNSPTKSFSAIDNSNSNNGWQLFVTERGMVFVEIVYSSLISKLSTRITYFSQIKSGLDTVSSSNIMFFNIGHNAAITPSYQLYNENYPHVSLGSINSAIIFSATPFPLKNPIYLLDSSNIDIVSGLYLSNTSKDLIIAEITGILSKVVNNSNDMYGISEISVGGRPAISICAGYPSGQGDVGVTLSYARTFLIYLDYWEY